jgi:hypothetical protein
MTNHPTSSSEHEEAARAGAALPPHRAPARATYLQRESATQAASRDTAPLSVGQFRMTFLIACIDAALTAAISRIGNKLCNALDASLYHDWDLEDTPNDGADQLAEREAEEEVAGTPLIHSRKPTAINRHEARSR